MLFISSHASEHIHAHLKNKVCKVHVHCDPTEYKSFVNVQKYHAPHQIRHFGVVL